MPILELNEKLGPTSALVLTVSLKVQNALKERLLNLKPIPQCSLLLNESDEDLLRSIKIFAFILSVKAKIVN